MNSISERSPEDRLVQLRRGRIVPQQSALEAILDGYINAQLKFMDFCTSRNRRRTLPAISDLKQRPHTWTRTVPNAKTP